MLAGPTGRVAPGLVVGGEDPQVAAAHKLLVVHGQQGAGGGQELRVEDDLNTQRAHRVPNSSLNSALLQLLQQAIEE